MSEFYDQDLTEQYNTVLSEKDEKLFTKPDGSSMNEDRYLKKYFQLREPNSILETESNE